MGWINRILVPIDLSACSAAALRYAVFLGEHSGATLHVVHVCETGPEAAGQGEMGEEAVLSLSRQRLKKQIYELLSHIRSEVARHAKVHVVAGDDASNAIVGLAREHHVDLIVMGKYGDNCSDVSHMGNVTAAVAEHAPCGVVPVHEPVARGAAFALAVVAANDMPRRDNERTGRFGAPKPAVLSMRRLSDDTPPLYH